MFQLVIEIKDISKSVDHITVRTKLSARNVFI